MAFTNAADLAANAPQSRLYPFPPTSTTAITVNGIPTSLQAGTPTFSPDNQHVAFDFLTGTIGTMTGDGTKLVALDYDNASKTFSNLRVLASMTGGRRAGSPRSCRPTPSSSSTTRSSTRTTATTPGIRPRRRSGEPIWQPARRWFCPRSTVSTPTA